MDRTLWLAVLLQGLQDAARGREPNWIWTRDFAAVCHLARVDPGQVRVRFQVRADHFAAPGKLGR